MYYLFLKLTKQSLFNFLKKLKRGKSGLHRAGCQITPGKRKLMTSATEKKPPISFYST